MIRPSLRLCDKCRDKAASVAELKDFGWSSTPEKCELCSKVVLIKFYNSDKDLLEVKQELKEQR